jgi:uncharacterized membrane protein
MALAAWVARMRLERKMAKVAADALRLGQELPLSSMRLQRLWFALGWPAFLALITLFALMVWKPRL